MTHARMGAERLVSIKLTWRDDTSASIARSGWLNRGQVEKFCRRYGKRGG